MTPQTYTFQDDGTFPNSRLPLILYRGALPADAGAIEQVFARNRWGNSWRDGIYDYHHFHTIAHEVLGVARGEVQVALGGPAGKVLTLRAGDVVVIPAGVAHCNQGDSGDLLVVGAYPGGSEYDTCRGNPADYDRVRQNIAQVPIPDADPVGGVEGPLRRLWR
ncbi:MAG: cupin [Acetobacteraceae bacterium]|nr:cupin [Acetobacteraceae bacterium]MBV8526343.1 cupin [Acetobacteraceae bacterium]MBV8589488.1 cupin [Acetobacteraceae bacterium]